MLSEKPLISIIVPAFNAGDFLEECLLFLQRQSLHEFEAIVVDDGSTDSTAEIAQAFADKDSRFRLVKMANGGVSRARNEGIELARGEFVCFVDADDLLHPRALEEMHARLLSHNAEVCIAGFISGAEFTGFPTYTGSEDRVMSYREAMHEALYQKRLLNSPWGTLVRRSLLGSERRFREGTRYEDLDAFYRFYEGCDAIVVTEAPLYFYRNNPGSFLNRWSRERLDVLDVTDRMLSFFESRYPELAPAARDRRFSAHFNMLLLLLKYDRENLETIQRCREVIEAGRLPALKDRNVRLKNKIGAIFSYGGMAVLKLLAGMGG